MRKPTLSAIAVLAALLSLGSVSDYSWNPLSPATVEAKSYGSKSSGSKSYGSKSSGSKSYGSKNNSKSYSSGTKSSSGSKPVSRPALDTKQKQYIQSKAKYDAAKKSGTVFTDKSKATSSFKQTHGSKYTSTYTSKPETRPTHIPSSYKDSKSGNTYNVTYNSRYGGYGYMGGSGSWIMYDAIADAAMLSLLMNNHNYYVGSAPTAPVAHVSSGPSIGMIMLAVVFGGFVVVIFIVILSTSQ